MEFPKKHVKDTFTGKSFSSTVCLIRYTCPCIELFISKCLGMSRFPDSAHNFYGHWTRDQPLARTPDLRRVLKTKGVQRPFRWNNNV